MRRRKRRPFAASPAVWLDLAASVAGEGIQPSGDAFGELVEERFEVARAREKVVGETCEQQFGLGRRRQLFALRVHQP